MDKYCTYCNCKLFEIDKFCSRCGTPTRLNIVVGNKPYKELLTRQDIMDEYLSLPYNQNISSDDYVKVVSLCPYKLNLGKERGDKNPFGFEKVGSYKMIQYKDLLEIIDFTRRFAEVGYYLIMNKYIVSIHNLESCYNEIFKQVELNDN